MLFNTARIWTCPHKKGDFLETIYSSIDKNNKKVMTKIDEDKRHI